MKGFSARQSLVAIRGSPFKLVSFSLPDRSLSMCPGRALVAPSGLKPLPSIMRAKSESPYRKNIQNVECHHTVIPGSLPCPESVLNSTVP